MSADKKLSLGSVDFVLHDNGNATATLTPDDAAGLDTVLPAGSSVPSWTPSDPTAITVAPSADGLTCLVTPASPAKLATAVTIAVACTLPDGTVITGTSDPIDVVAGGPVGFKIALA